MVILGPMQVEYGGPDVQKTRANEETWQQLGWCVFQPSFSFISCFVTMATAVFL